MELLLIHIAPVADTHNQDAQHAALNVGDEAVVTYTSKKRLPPPFGLEGHDGVATQPSAEEEISMSTITIDVDLAKNVFSVCVVANGWV